MKVIGITGSSGSGKSTVAKIFEEKYGAILIDADKVVKELSVPNTKYMKAIKIEFGEEFFENNGNLNKKKLAETIYSNKHSLEKLNSLTFEYIVKEIEKRVKEIEVLHKEESLLIIDAPLLIEAGLDKLCNYIVAVLADREIKIQRICIRDGLDKKTAESRLNIQKEDSFYVKNAKFLIYNNGQENLEEEIKKIVKKIQDS